MIWSRRPTGAGRAALRACRTLPLTARVHASLRWWSAPFPAMEAAVPRAGRVLEIGCGHGLFSTFLTLSSAQRSVVGVDIDATKIALAQAVAHGLPGEDLRFEVGVSGTVPAGPWHAIVIVDVLYLLPAGRQADLLAAAVEQLAPRGLLLIKEMSPTPRWKARWNRWQETVTVSILGITQTTGERPPATASDGRSRRGGRFDFVDPATMAGWLRGLGLTTSSRRLDRHRVHPHFLLMGRVPSS
jgi:SAM-dependent methyltransferase